MFRERIRFLDKKIQPGLTKLLWSTKGTSNLFITECCTHVTKVTHTRTHTLTHTHKQHTLTPGL